MPSKANVWPFPIISTAIPDVAPNPAQARSGHAIFAKDEQLLMMSGTGLVDALVPDPASPCAWSGSGAPRTSPTPGSGQPGKGAEIVGGGRELGLAAAHPACGRGPLRHRRVTRFGRGARTAIRLLNWVRCRERASRARSPSGATLNRIAGEVSTIPVRRRRVRSNGDREKSALAG
jgi:hypothetical protein